MGKQFKQLDESHIKFIQNQKIFFTGTAGATGLVNVSPKGMDSFRVISAHEILWLNYTGSGNETAAHILQNPRMTVMFCSFTEEPLILRIYGTAQAVHPTDAEWQEKISFFGNPLGARQIFRLAIELVQTSCGFAVPFYEYKGERNSLVKWAENKGNEGIRDYWQEKNKTSLDGFPTGI